MITWMTDDPNNSLSAGAWLRSSSIFFWIKTTFIKQKLLFYIIDMKWSKQSEFYHFATHCQYQNFELLVQDCCSSFSLSLSHFWNTQPLVAIIISFSLVFQTLLSLLSSFLHSSVFLLRLQFSFQGQPWHHPSHELFLQWFEVLSFLISTVP